MEGSSLRIIVGTYSALGTLEEMSCKEKKRIATGRGEANREFRSTKAMLTVPCSVAPPTCYPNQKIIQTICIAAEGPPSL